MKRRELLLITFISLGCLVGCAQEGPRIPLVQVPDCSGTPSTNLENYDRLSANYVDEIRYPSDNLGGNVVWGTRYYLESLLTAYEATRNLKYIQAFVDSGESVLSLVQSKTVLNVPDSSAPGKDGPLLSVMGWPTVIGSFGTPVAVPTESGDQISLYAQSISPGSAGGAKYFTVSQQSDGSLELAWVGASKTLETETIDNLNDLDAVASAPLVDTSNGLTPGRIFSTGAGLPAPGRYSVSTPLQTVWHEQTGGILLPFAHFLLLAKEYPGLVDYGMREAWTSKIIAIAYSYEDEFVSDGHGGLEFRNPMWLPNLTAGLDAATDYIAVEATFRLFLYELTGDISQFQIAKGLVVHEENSHWSVNAEGWLLLQFWPDFIPWSNCVDAPAGNILSAYEFDPRTPAPVTDAGFVVDLLHYAKLFRLERQLGLTASLYAANQQTFQQYLYYARHFPPEGSNALLRADYPTESSTASDSVTPTQDPFAGTGFLTPEVADQHFVNAKWDWMLNYAQDPRGGSIGYFLRAWARSESAELRVCNYPF